MIVPPRNILESKSPKSRIVVTEIGRMPFRAPRGHECGVLVVITDGDVLGLLQLLFVLRDEGSVNLDLGCLRDADIRLSDTQRPGACHKYAV